MSGIVICDRCRAVIGSASPSVHVPVAMRVVNKTNYVRSTDFMFGEKYDANDVYDLCADCAASFEEWFIQGQEELPNG